MSNNQAACVFPKIDPSIIIDYPTSEWPTTRAEDLSGQMFAVRKEEGDNEPHNNLKRLADMDDRIWYTSNCRKPGGHSNDTKMYTGTYQIQLKQMHVKSGRKRVLDKSVQKKYGTILNIRCTLSNTVLQTMCNLTQKKKDDQGKLKQLNP